MMKLANCVLYVLLAISSVLAEFSREDRDLYPQQVHLSSTGDSNSLFVTWTTLEDAGDGFLFLEEAAYPGQWKMYNASNKTQIERMDTNTNDTRSTFVYRSRMIGLIPGYLYRYKVGVSPYYSGLFTFTHQPIGLDSFPSFAIYGDLSLSQPISFPKLIEDAHNGLFQAVFHLGDISYELKDDLGRKGDKFMNMLQPLAAKVPYNFIVGNHEHFNNFSEFSGRFTSEGPSVFYHSYNMGPIHFVIFSTSFYRYEEYGIGQIQAQYNWLVEDLKQANKPESRARQPWIVALGHRPVNCPNNTYSKDCEKYEMIKTVFFQNEILDLEDLFFQNGVDLQFYGHYHGYKRTFPVFRDMYDECEDPSSFVDPRYPIHVTSGVASWCYEDRKELPDAVNLSELGYSILKVVDKHSLEITQVSSVFSQTIDKFKLKKSRDYPSFGVYEDV